MIQYEVEVSIKLQGPILTRSTNAAGFGLDAVFFRDGAGRLALPGTHVKGKLREAWEQLRGWKANVPSEDEVTRFLGCGTADARTAVEAGPSGYEPKRGLLKFPECFPCKEEDKQKRITRIQIDDDRGSAEDSMLLVEERPFAAGERICFTGTLLLWAKDAQEAKGISEYCERGLRAVGAFGGNQGVGYGRVVGVEVGQPSEGKKKDSWDASGVGEEWMGIRLVTKDPVCVTEFRPEGNVFVGVDILPGGVIKGALATQMERMDPNGDEYGALRKNLAQLRILHGRPAKLGELGMKVRPLSLVIGEQPKGNLVWKDAVLQKTAKLLGGSAPRFEPDWKDTDTVVFGEQFPQIRLERELRIRTKIDPKNKRAEDEQLFAYEMVLPRAGGEDVEWVSGFGFSGIAKEERPQVRQQLSKVLRMGLGGVGKTKAHFTVGLDTNTMGREEPAILDGKVVLTLQSDALIGDPRLMTNKYTGEDLHQFYQKAWDDLSGGEGLTKLSHFFASQKLAGGRYHLGRFQARGERAENAAHSYRPWLLTKAGSVFVFEVEAEKEKEVLKLLQCWQSRGLGLGKKVVDAYDLPKEEFERWKRCPYVPENGFGEIAVNEHRAWENFCKWEEA